MSDYECPNSDSGVNTLNKRHWVTEHLNMQSELSVSLEDKTLILYLRGPRLNSAV